MVQALMEFLHNSHKQTQGAEAADQQPLDMTADKQWSSAHTAVLSQVHQSMQLAAQTKTGSLEELAALHLMEAVLQATLSPSQVRSLLGMVKMVDAAQDDAAAKSKDKDICLSIAFVAPLAPTFKALVAYKVKEDRGIQRRDDVADLLTSCKVEDACMEWHDEMVRQAMKIITYVVTRLKAQWEELSQALASTMVSLALEGDRLLEV